jgi:hypothetical protein
MRAIAQPSTWNLVAAIQGARTAIHATGEVFPVILHAKSDKAHVFTLRSAQRWSLPGKTPMTTAIHWRLDVIAQGDHLTDAAMEVIADMNEAKALVHGVVARALAGVTGPVSRRDLDADMGRALRLWAAPASSAT